MRACTYCRKILSAADARCPDDESPGVEVALAEPRAELSERFGPLEPFAAGATGTSFIGPDKADRVLVKLLDNSFASEAADRVRSSRELQKQVAIAHPHLPRVFETGDSEGRLWLAREFVPGESLAVRVRRSGPFSVPNALSVIAQLATALDELHRQGLVHRELKPGHVLLGRRAQGGDIAYLVDAGIGPRVVASPDALRLDNATYISPEVASGEAAGFRSDLYALGCLLFELLAGKPPFERPNLAALLAAHREQTPPALPRDVEVPEPVRALIASLLAKDPRRRPFSAQQVRRTLDPFVPAGTPPAPSTRTSAPPPPSAAGRASVPNPDATQELGPDDLRFAVSLPLDRRVGPSRTPTLRPSEMRPVRFPIPSTPVMKTQEIRTAELEQIGQEPKSQRIRSSMPARPSTLGMSKRISQRAVDDSAPTTALSLDHPHDVQAAPAPEAEQSSEIDLTPLIEAEEASAEASALQPPEPTPSVPPPAAASVPPPVPERSAPPPEPMVLQSLPQPAAAISGEASSLEIAAAAPPAPTRQAWKPIAEGEAVGGPKKMNEASQTLSLRAQPELSAVLRASRRPSFTESPTILLWSVAALLVGAVAVRAVRGSGPVHVGAVEVPRSEAVHVKVPEADAPAAVAAPVAAPQPSAANAEAAAPPAANEPAVAAAPAEPPAAAPEPPNEETNPEVTSERHGQTLSAVQAGKGFRGRSEVDYKAKAREFFQAGKYKEAAENYAHATHRAPTDSAAFAGLGASWLAAGEPNRAIVAYQRAVQLKPDVSGFQAALGRAYATKGDRGRAAAAYSKALNLDPNNQAAKTGLASVKR